MANSTPTLVPPSLNPATCNDTSLNAVLALDLGTHTGWALWQADRSITSGTPEFDTKFCKLLMCGGSC